MTASQSKREGEGEDFLRPSGWTVLVALATGFVLGVAIRGVLWLVDALTGLVWGNAVVASAGSLAPLVVCPLGGLAIGLYTRRFGGQPSTLAQVLADIRAKGRYEVESLPRSIGGFLLPLAFGGSVGPEAGLSGLVATGCSWIVRSLKETGRATAEAAELGIMAVMSAVFGAPLAGLALVGSGEEGSELALGKATKVLLYLSAAVGAFGGMLLFGTLVGKSEGLPRFDAFVAAPADLVAVVPCLAAAYALSFVWAAAEKAFGRAASAIGDRPVAKALAVGAVLGLVAVALPEVLFSGESQTHELMESWTEYTAWMLALIAVAKLTMTALCVSFGWKGGHLFPCIFAGVACGYAIAMVTGTEALLCTVLVTSTLLARVLGRPLLTILLLFLCFPAHGIVWMTLGAIIGAHLPIPRALTAEDLQA